MQLVSDFLEAFRSCLLQLNPDQLLAMNMPDDITGWGITREDDFNSLDSLYPRVQQRCQQQADIELEPLDAFGNGHAAVVICQYKRKLALKSGNRIKDDNLRFSFYLVEANGALKMRHAHLSKPWLAGLDWPNDPIPVRSDFGKPASPVRLNEAQMRPFIEHLQKRVAYTESTNVKGLASLQHHGNSNVFWPMQGAELRGNEQYRRYLEHLSEQYPSPFLKYYQPVVFQNHSLACLSAYAEVGYQTGRVLHTISPLRVSYFLQEQHGEWLCRHSHWSLPFGGRAF
ncbi:MAG: hypothetical protein ACPG5T_01125 [Endozoicomonas sp.]